MGLGSEDLMNLNSTKASTLGNGSGSGSALSPKLPHGSKVIASLDVIEEDVCVEEGMENDFESDRATM